MGSKVLAVTMFSLEFKQFLLSKKNSHENKIARKNVNLILLIGSPLRNSQGIVATIEQIVCFLRCNLEQVKHKMSKMFHETYYQR